MPILQDIASAAGQAAMLTRFVADPPTTTMQRLKGLMTGGLPTFIDVGSSFSAAAVTEDNLIDQLRHHGKQLAFFGDDTWMQLFPTQFQRAIPFSSFNVMDLHTVDDGVWQNLIPTIREPAEWDVVIGHYLGVDHVGHTYDVHSPHMAAKLQQMNQHVEQVVKELVSMAGPGEAHEHTLLLVFGDHGQTLTGDHGGGAPEEVDSALLALNMGAYHRIRHQQEICTTSESDTDDQAERMLDSSMPQIDFAPSVAALMGVPIPFGNIGQISEELWNVAHSALTFMNDSHVHDGGLCQEPYIHALQSNAAQVHTYLNAYAAHGRASLPKAQLQHLNQLYQQAVASNKSHSSEVSSSRSSKDRYAEYLGAAAQLAREQWTQFNLPLMLLGLLLFTACLLLQAYTLWHSLPSADHSPSLSHQHWRWLLPSGAVTLVVTHAAGLFSISFILSEGQMVCFLVATFAVLLLHCTLVALMHQPSPGVAVHAHAHHSCSGNSTNHDKRIGPKPDPEDASPSDEARQPTQQESAASRVSQPISLALSGRPLSRVSPAKGGKGWNRDCSSAVVSGLGLLVCNALLGSMGLVVRTGHDAMHKAAAAAPSPPDLLKLHNATLHVDLSVQFASLHWLSNGVLHTPARSQHPGSMLLTASQDQGRQRGG
ncbi:hypothetical protein WJX77_009614 [Trebouxia sp. C0004]